MSNAAAADDAKRGKGGVLAAVPQDDDAQDGSVTIQYDDGHKSMQAVRARSVLFRAITLPLYVLALLLVIVAILIVVVPWLVCKTGSSDRVRKQSSKTAEATTLGRYHNWVCGIGQDKYAGSFLPWHLRFAVRLATLPWTFARSLFDAGTGVAGMMLGRTSFLDGAIRYAVKEQGAENLILCGAGYDTRAIRMADDLKDVKVFEVDTEATQKAKLAALKRAKLAVPDNTTFCAINFNDQDLFQVLEHHNFDKSKRTIVIWEGVAMYLTRETVDAFLASLTANLAPGSLLGMDWFWDSLGKPKWKGYFHGHDFSAKLATNKGEPYLSGLPEPFEQATVAEYFGERGLGLVEHLKCKSPEATQRYLTMSNGQRVGRLYEADNFLLLRVEPGA